MKILFCSNCEDVIRIKHTTTTCSCSSSKATLQDDDTTVLSGPFAISMDMPLENFKGLLSFFKDNKVNRRSRKEITQEDIDFCIAVIQYLNEQAGTDFKTHYPSDHTRLITDRRADHQASLDDFKAVIDKCVKKWKDTEFAQYLRPSTLFSKHKFPNYLGEASNGKPEQRPAASTQFASFRNSVRAAKKG